MVAMFGGDGDIARIENISIDAQSQPVWLEKRANANEGQPICRTSPMHAAGLIQRLQAAFFTHVLHHAFAETCLFG